VAVTHTTNCCGTDVWIGINVAVKPQYSTLEAACDMSYPGCGCAAFSPTADDGSVINFGATAGIVCQAGLCKTYAVACGHPCDTGRSCGKCTVNGVAKSTCMLRCTKPADCTEPMLTMCTQSGPTGGICTSPDAMCSAF
jgi:hypothetical protein